MLFDEVKIIYGFPDGKTVAAYKANGKEAIVGGSGASGIKVYDTNVDDQEYINTEITEHLESVTCIAAGKDGTFASGGEDGIVALYKPDNTLNTFLVRSTVPIRSISFHPSGSKLAIATDENTIRIVLTADISKIVQLEGHTCPVKSVDYHPSGNFLLSSDISGNLKIWDVSASTPPPKCIKTIPEFTYKSEIDSILQTTVAWSPDESSFAFPGTNKNVRIFRSDSWTPLHNLEGQHTGNVITLAWSPNGHYLASSAEDNSFVIWDTKTKKTVFSEVTSAQITGIAWSPTENELTICDMYGQVRIWKDVIAVSSEYPHPAIMRNKPASQNVLRDELPRVKTERGAPPPATETFDEEMDMFDDLGEDVEGLDMNDHSDNIPASFAMSDDDNDEPQQDRPMPPRPVKKDPTSIWEKQMKISMQLIPPTSFQPGETPYHPPLPGTTFAPLPGERRYMCFNAVGFISTTFEEDYSSVNVEFHDQSEFSNFYFRDEFNYTVGALSTTGAVFAVEGQETRVKTTKPIDEEGSDHEEEVEEVVRVNSSLYFRSNARGSNTNDWTHTMLPGEDVICVALNRISVIATTSFGYVRIFSTSGVQRHIFSLENVVSVTAITDLAFIVYSKGPAFNTQQNLQYMLINTDTGDILQKDRVQLTVDSELTWIGFSETNQAATYDSAGILRVLERQRRPFQGSWVPVFNGKAHAKSVERSERYWPVRLLRDRLLCIVLRGSNTYPFFPLPPIIDVPLQLPLLHPTTETGQLEEEVLRINTTNHHERDEAEATGTEEAYSQVFNEADIEMDVALLKLINLACKAEKISRAVDLTYTLHSEDSIDKAIKIASFHRFTGLAEKMINIKEEKFIRFSLPTPSTLQAALQALPDIYHSSETALDGDLSFVQKQDTIFKRKRPTKRSIREDKIRMDDDEDDSTFQDTQASKRAKPFQFK